MASNDKLDVFEELMLCCLSLCIWYYDEDFHLLRSSCPEPWIQNAVFSAQSDRIRSLYEEGLLPAVIESGSGLSWALTAKKDAAGGVTYLVLGPIRTGGGRETPADRDDPDFLHPILSSQELTRYASMLHRAATGETAAVHRPDSSDPAIRDASAILLLARLQDKIRTGDLSYKELMSEVLINHNKLMNLGVVTTDSAKKTAKLTIDLCCQAAMETGLAKKPVDALRTEYLPLLKAANAGYEIARICDMLMYHLVRLVRRSKGSPNFSEPVQTCCTYIEEHVCDRLTLEFLAKQTGYSPDHLSKKFRQEFGQSLKDYILQSKIRRAQLMLTTTTMPVCDIAAMFSFCSGSHFTRVFQRFSGDTPANYRKRHNHLS